MNEATRRVQETARDASSNDDLVRDEFEMAWDENDMLIPLDKETLDERASTQMGSDGPTRRDAN
jgi:hypothetical protein